MSPSFAFYDTQDISGADAKSLAQLAVRILALRIEIANFTHMLGGKFGAGIKFPPFAIGVFMPAALVTPGSSFACHIRRVVGGSANKQVFGIATQAVVAIMAYLFTIWNWTVSKFVGIAVWILGFTVNHYVSISAGAFGAHPEPAISGLVERFPESLIERDWIASKLIGHSYHLYGHYTTWIRYCQTGLRGVKPNGDVS